MCFTRKNWIAQLWKKTWSSLDDQLRKQMLQSVLDGLKLRNPGRLAPKLKDINNSLRQFYTMRRNSKLISVDKELRVKKRRSAKINRMNCVRNNLNSTVNYKCVM